MGLFSVLDVILEKPMEEAMEMVMVSGDIREALIYNSGTLAPVLELIVNYESANWQEVSRQMLLGQIDVRTVNDAYRAALGWYRELMAAEK